MRISFDVPFSGRSAGVAAVLLTIGLGAGVAGASSYHRLAAMSVTGSEGAMTVNNTSASGGAIEGTVATSPDASFTIPFGVLGEYITNSSTFGIGVTGLSTTGYGVAAETLGASPAFLALNKGPKNGPGAEIGTSAGTGDALEVSAGGSGYGVLGASSTGTAAFFSSSANSNTGGAALVGVATGEGLIAEGGSGTSAHPALSVVSKKLGTDLFTATDDTGNVAFVVQAGTADRGGTFGGAQTDYYHDVQVSGDFYVYGKIFDNCTNPFPVPSTETCSDVTDAASRTTKIVARGSNAKVVVFGTEQSEPTIEDFGHATLVRGAAYVPLDAKFAATISTQTRYEVIVTPEGDSNGLYVTHNALAGFEVHENRGGRSTLDFSYRIVARPITTDNVTRFAVASERPKHGIARPNASGLATLAHVSQAIDRANRLVKAQPSLHALPF